MRAASSPDDTAAHTLSITDVNDPPSGLPTITGVATEDQVLSAANTLGSDESQQN